MKTKMLTLTLALLTSAAFAGPCPKPNEYAASAFQIIEGIKPGDLETYLRDYTVARTAVNENCEDMYVLSLKKRNETARLLLEKIGYGPKKAEDINQKRVGYMSYFDYAHGYASYSVIRDLKARGGVSYSALHSDSLYNSIDVIDALLAESKAPLDASLLVNAVSTNKKNVIEQLIRRGVDVTHVNLMPTAVYRASKNPADKDILELLVRAGASLNSVQVMAQAAGALNVEILEFLIRAGGPVDISVLDGAVKAQKMENIKLIIKSGVRLDERLSKGESILMTALGTGNIEVIEYLISQGLDIFAIDKEGNNAFTYVRDDKMINYLAKKGVRIDQTNREGLAPLHVAIKNNDSFALASLAKAGADVNTPTALGFYPIHLAFQHACSDLSLLVQALIDHGVNVNQKNKEGFTPLMRAAQMGRCGSTSENEYSQKIGNKIIKVLLMRRADRRTTVKWGRDRYNAQDFYTQNNNSDSEITKLLDP